VACRSHFAVGWVLRVLYGIATADERQNRPAIYFGGSKVVVLAGCAAGSYRKGTGILRIATCRRLTSLPIVWIRVGATPTVCSIAFTR
jgi:hypothetical protein